MPLCPVPLTKNEGTKVNCKVSGARSLPGADRRHGFALCVRDDRVIIQPVVCVICEKHTRRTFQPERINSSKLWNLNVQWQCIPCMNITNVLPAKYARAAETSGDSSSRFHTGSIEHVFPARLPCASHVNPFAPDHSTDYRHA